MGVLIEGANVLIRNAVVDRRFPGGMHEYELSCPNGSFCTDGIICRIGFMVTADAVSFIEHLQSHGFSPPTSQGSPEVALVFADGGFVQPCDWLELGQVNVGGATPTAVAWARGTTPSELVAPPNWEPRQLIRMTPEELGEQEYVGTEGGVDSHRERATGELLHAFRTREDVPPAHLTGAVIQEQFSSLVDELARLTELEGVPLENRWADLFTLRDRARLLVADTRRREPGPLMLEGLASRQMEEWNEAASAFRGVTELAPAYFDAWMELTATLATMRRFEEAEPAARTALRLEPEDANALGNLAAVLHSLGKLDEARQLAEKAVRARPADAQFKRLLAAIERAASR